MYMSCVYVLVHGVCVCAPICFVGCSRGFIGELHVGYKKGSLANLTQ